MCGGWREEENVNHRDTDTRIGQPLIQSRSWFLPLSIELLYVQGTSALTNNKD